MSFQQFTIETCCGSFKTVYQLSFALRRDHVKVFTSAGFSSSGSFYQAGLMYIENMDFTATGAFGQSRVEINCKKPKCQANLADFEKLLNSLG